MDVENEYMGRLIQNIHMHQQIELEVLFEIFKIVARRPSRWCIARHLLKTSVIYTKNFCAQNKKPTLLRIFCFTVEFAPRVQNEWMHDYNLIGN